MSKLENHFGCYDNLDVLRAVYDPSELSHRGFIFDASREAIGYLNCYEKGLPYSALRDLQSLFIHTAEILADDRFEYGNKEIFKEAIELIKKRNEEKKRGQDSL